MRRLWAVARETFLECLRTRIVLLFLMLLGTCVILMAMFMEGDGTLKGRIQTFLSYSGSAAQLLLGLVTVFLATSVITRDVQRKYIFLVASKPLSRWQYIVGRWAGLVMLDALLLAVSFGAIYGFAQYLRAQPTRDELRRAAGLLPANWLDRDRLAVESEVFTARLRFKPRPIDIKPLVDQRMNELDQQKGMDNLIKDRLARGLRVRNVNEHRPQEQPSQQEIDEAFADPATRQRVRAAIAGDVTKEIDSAVTFVRVGDKLDFVFENVPTPSYDEPLYLTYKLHPRKTPENRTFHSSWVVYDKDAGPRPLYPQSDSTESVNTVLVPPDAVRHNQVSLWYLNADLDVNTPVKFEMDEVTLLIRSGSFEGNIARAAAIVLLRMMFLAGIGFLFGAFLSFPVACLTCLLVLAVGFMNGFIQEATNFEMAYNSVVTPTLFVSHYLAAGLCAIVPDFGRNSPVDCLVDGEIMPGSAVLRELGLGLGLRTWAALALGCVIFYRRELARVQV